MAKKGVNTKEIAALARELLKKEEILEKKLKALERKHKSLQKKEKGLEIALKDDQKLDETISKKQKFIDFFKSIKNVLKSDKGNSVVLPNVSDELKTLVNQMKIEILEEINKRESPLEVKQPMVQSKVLNQPGPEVKFEIDQAIKRLHEKIEKSHDLTSEMATKSVVKEHAVEETPKPGIVHRIKDLRKKIVEGHRKKDPPKEVVEQINPSNFASIYAKKLKKFDFDGSIKEIEEKKP
ncbi:MAG: hypothetical protein QF915_03455 [Candidatus Woesearchaeota archaeon]|nr:hypothetical protein [Candidatus Woesearchaeota archaeon]